jgi:signal transduction histidine kinase
LIRAQEAVASHPAGTVDLVAELAALERLGTVTVAAPATSVELPAETARELLGVVRACLDNVRAHVGDDAPAWVLLRAFPDRVELSVRDGGGGIPAGHPLPARPLRVHDGVHAHGVRRRARVLPQRAPSVGGRRAG